MLTILEALATLVALGSTWPQVARSLRRRGESDPAGGLATSTWWCTHLTLVGWSVWSFRAGHPVAGLSFASSVVGWLIVGSLAWPSTARRFDVVAVAATVGAAALAAPLWSLELAASAFGVLLYLPQAFAALRRPLPGVSATAWLMYGAEEVTWAVWALAIGKPLLAWPLVVVIPATLLVARAARAAGPVSALVPTAALGRDVVPVEVERLIGSHAAA